VCDSGLGGERSGEDPPEYAAGKPGASSTASRNELSGVVHGPAIQAASIHGGVHFSVARPAAFRLPAPAQLPPPPAHFTGRSKELASLDYIASQYSPARRLTVAVIMGPGGAGKTSLASHWLHGISDGYEGGALFTDLRGQIPEAAAQPGDVLAGFLRALGTPEEQIPLGLADQVALFRTVTSGRRMIVLLDNAASAAQVRCLLPGPGPRTRPGAQAGAEPGTRPSLVVVTTRWRISGLAMEGGCVVEAGPLDEVSAVELFGRMIGPERASAEQAAARAVVRLCGGLPLAVCVAGARLTQHPRWPIQRVADELLSRRHRLAALSLPGDLSVRGTFDVSYEALPAGAARMYRLASLLPGPDFSPGLAAAAVAADPGPTSELLEMLAAASLLEERGDQRFCYHDLVKLHAREKADEEPADQRRIVVTRAVDWYLRTAVAADIVVSPGRWRLNPMFEQASRSRPAYHAPAAALEWLEAWLPGLLATVETAHEEGLHQQAWQLCEALWGVFLYRKHFQEWISSHLIGLASAQTCGDPRAEARMRVQLGTAYRSLGQYAVAGTHFTRALALAREEGHHIGEATALEQLALTDLSQGRPDEAIPGFTEARGIHERIGVPRGVALTTRHIGEAHRDAGRYPEAITELSRARSMLAALPDPYMEARVLTSLAQAHILAGRPHEAAQPLTEALDTMGRLGSPYEQARIHRFLADVASQLGDTATARFHLHEALTIFDETGAPEADQVRRKLAEPGPAPTPGTPR
jgi:tetratricopeptide (TPR) repeat protein